MQHLSHVGDDEVGDDVMLPGDSHPTCHGRTCDYWLPPAIAFVSFHFSGEVEKTVQCFDSVYRSPVCRQRPASNVVLCHLPPSRRIACQSPKCHALDTANPLDVLPA